MTHALTVVSNDLPTCLVEVASGARLDINNPDPADINIDDIAQCLAVMPRYLGHARKDRLPYSVAMHNLWVAQYLMASTGDATLVMQGLLRDGYKAYIGDIPRPTIDSLQIYQEMKALEDRVQTALYTALNIPALTPGNARWIACAKAQAMKAETDAMLLSGGLDWQLPELDMIAKTIGYLDPVEPWIAELAYTGYLKNLQTKGRI